MEQLFEGDLSEETDELDEDLPQCYSLHNKSHVV
jgi:hypothetical protein